MSTRPVTVDLAALAARLRAGGCVFAEEEAHILADAASDPAHLDTLVTRRLAGEPLEHLVGAVRFGDLTLSVGPGVFIPRQRSLLLAQATLDAARGFAEPVVVEAFCGVAPIAATVRHRLPHADLHVTDLDPLALGHARRNLGGQASYHAGPGLRALPDALRGMVSVIAAVPPYVPDSALYLLPHEAHHEPRRALLGGPDGLDHIRTLISEAPEFLAGRGTLLVEMNRTQADAVLGGIGPVWASAGRLIGDDGQNAVLRLVRGPI
ncbi:N5-glutamine methyltransferase family protein [Gordonia sp. NPDC003425]